MFQKRIFLGIFALLLLVPLASSSEAKLWDLQIQADMQKSPIVSGERPIVSGVIVDHASKPVPKADVNVKSEGISIFTTTSQSGEFMAELGKHDRIPGNYIVTISATTSDGKTGITNVQYQVKGELSASAVSHQKLSTPEAQKYLNSNPDDFDKNPLGLMLYKYYQKLYQEYLAEVEIDQKIAENQAIIEEQQATSLEYREKAIEEYKPGAGIFSGPEYEEYVNSLDEEVRDTVVLHLEFTKNLFFEAQIVRNEILEKGGTPEEAQIAYLEKISTTREKLENLDNQQDNLEFSEGTSPSSSSDEQSTLPEVVTDDQSIEDLKSKNNVTEEKNPIIISVDGTMVQVDYKDSVFFVEVNGVVLEFVLENGQLVRINSE